jgi:single-strand DNA-binding protein
MINNVVLTGRLTKDVELKYTPSGVAVGNFTLAVNRTYKNAQGETETDFIKCVVWRKQAETMAKHLKKGNLIGVNGNLQSRSYENSEGKRIFVLECIVDSFTFLESKNTQPQQPPQQYNRYGA